MDKRNKLYAGCIGEGNEHREGAAALASSAVVGEKRRGLKGR